MSAQRWPFNTLSAAAAADAAVLAACARMGIAPHTQALPARGAMLRFDVTSPLGAMRLAVAADDWCPAMLPDLAELAWAELIDPAALACWLPQRPLLDFVADSLHTAEVTLCDVVQVNALKHGGARRPMLQTAQGHAWILHAQPAPAALHLHHPPLQLRLPVDLAVARFSVPLQRLRTLAPGAVVLLDQLLPVARTGRRRLYSFDFTLETISVNTSFDFLDEDDDADIGVASPSAPPAAAAAPAGIDVARLPVMVDVVLCQLQQHVGDLAALQPGTVFDLPPDAWKQLQLRVNGQLIARGELVQVGEQLGVQLHQAPLLP
jgi:type III secretion protein Q